MSRLRLRRSSSGRARRRLRRRIGSLFLYANQVLDSRAPETIADDLDIARTLVPAWDLANPGDFAYTMSRTSAILSALNGKLAGQPLKAGSLEIGDFRAIVFALISWIKKNAEGVVLPGWFSRSQLLRDFPRAQPALDELIASYSLYPDQFRDAFGGPAASEEDFAQRIEEVRFFNARPGLSCSIKAFYDHPLLRLDADRVSVLDPALLSLLLTRGLYWKIFDSLRGRKREDFKAAWGGCFETYGAAMLRYFFPAASNRLWTNVNHGDGEVDAILDYGSYAVLFELKSALLAEPAKRGGERDALKADIDKRYVRDDNGPRAVVQLARACRAARQGKLGLTSASARLYPVIVTDEVCASAPGFNHYLHGRFKQEAPPTETAPLTVMSIVELEELLPYLDTGALAFDALLNSRFTASDDVSPFLSVHQSIYQANVGKPKIRNDYLLKHFESLRDDIRSLFGTG